MSVTTKHILNREPVDPRAARSVCVLGCGVTGEAVARFFRACPDPPTVTVLTDDAEAVGSFDLTVVSPGIPPHSALVARARALSQEVISEPELAFRLSPERWIVITGTNGKTTTTALIAHLLNACGMKARAVGNIGPTCIEAVRTREAGEYLVAELSSYQLAYSSSLAPVAAVLLNITPDHLSWHGSFEDYRAAKLGLFDRMDPAAPAVIDATLDETRTVVRARRAAQKRTIPIGTANGLYDDMTARCGAPEAAFVDPHTHELTCVVNGRCLAVLPASQLTIRGEHNQENALAAAAIALSLGAAPKQVARGLVSFEPLEHRIEPCGSVDGVTFFNDSKATNPEATLTALAAFEGMPLVVMLGGRDKNTSLDALVAAATASCRAVVCYGEAASRFAQAFAAAAPSATSAGTDAPASTDTSVRSNAFAFTDTSVLSNAPASTDTSVRSSASVFHDASTSLIAPIIFCVSDFSSAFDSAVTVAQAGDVVLLSPACASFDEFSSYEQRGEAFKAAVSALRMRQEEQGSYDGR